MNDSEFKKRYGTLMSELGKRGIRKRMRGKTKEEISAEMRSAVQKRWAKKKQV